MELWQLHFFKDRRYSDEDDLRLFVAPDEEACHEAMRSEQPAGPIAYRQLTSVTSKASKLTAQREVEV